MSGVVFLCAEIPPHLHIYIIVSAPVAKCATVEVHKI